MRSFFACLGVCFLLVTAAACNGGGGGSNPPVPSPDFSLAVTPPPTIVAGTSGTTAVSVSRTGGHTAAITLSIAANGQNINGTGTIASGSSSGTLAINVLGAVAAGSYSLTASGTDGTLTRTSSFILTVNPAPDFSLAVTPPGTITAGSAGSATVTVVRIGGHGAAITMSLAANAQGITGSGAIASGANSGLMTISVPAPVAGGTYALTANGIDGTLSHTAVFNQQVAPAPVPDFSLGVTPPASIQASKSGTATVTATRTNGHVAAITLSLASNPQGITGGGTITSGAALKFVLAASSGSLTINVPGSVTAGTYSLTMNGSDGTLSHDATFNLVVTAAPDFSLSVVPPASIQAGSGGSTSVTATRSGGHTAAITLTLPANPQGITGSGSIASGASSGTLVISVPGAAVAGTYPLTANCSDGTLTRTGSFNLTVTAAPASNFSLSVTPPAGIVSGASGNTTVTAARTGGHAAAITLSITNNAQGITGNGTIAGGASMGTLTITVPGTVVAGTYPLTASGTDGTLIHTGAFSLFVTAPPPPNFTLSVATPLNILAGASGSTTVTAARTGGHTAAITLSLSANAQSITGNGTIASGASTGTLTINVPGAVGAGTYALTASGTDGVLTKTGTFNQTVTIPGLLDLAVPVVYITQATQTQAFDVPLVKDRNGYLRAFVVANQVNTATPRVRVRIYNGSNVLQQTYPIPAPGSSVPTSINESSLTNSWNVAIPAAYIQTGYKLLVDVDDNNTVVETNEANNTWPLSGTAQTLDVRTLNPFRVTFWAVQTGDTRIGNVNSGSISTFTSLLEKIWPTNAATDRVFGGTFTTSLVTLTSSTGDWGTILSELSAKRAVDGVTNRYYYGVVNPSYGGGIAGYGQVYGPTAIGWDKTNPGYGDSGIMSGVFAHEVGHNFGISHAPCGSVGSYDLSYPYPGGVIGAWGTDVSGPTLMDPTIWKDIMGYCTSVWVSDYNYKKVLANRQGGAVPIVVDSPPEDSTTPRSLLLWGRLENGVPILQPAFHMAVDALPPPPGEQLLEGFDAVGQRVFAIPFGMVEVGCLPEGSAQHFSFTIPVSVVEHGRLAELRWTKAGETLARRGGLGPERPMTLRATMEPMTQAMFDGRTRLLWDAAAHPTVIVRDKVSGLVIGIGEGGDFRFSGEAENLELHFSDGVHSHSQVVRRPRLDD